MCMTDNDCNAASPWDSTPTPSDSGSYSGPSPSSGMCGKCMGFWTIVLIAAVVALFISKAKG